MGEGPKWRQQGRACGVGRASARGGRKANHG